MDYQHLEKTAMCYRCIHKELCKTVYQADDLGIQQSKWNCPKFTEESHQEGWIPVSERLPEQGNQSYLVTVDYGNGLVCSCQRFFFNEDIGWNDDCVIAWQPLPEPYEKRGRLI